MKTLTLNLQDALISPISFAMLSGAGIFESDTFEDTQKQIVHVTEDQVCENGKIKIKYAVAPGTDVYAYVLDEAGAVEHYLAGTQKYVAAVPEEKDELGKVTKAATPAYIELNDLAGLSGTNFDNKVIRVDYYAVKSANEIQQLNLTPEDFAGFYYIEAEGLWRNEADGVDYPCVITIPRGKIQTNFTLSMSAEGDPSTFDFVVDAMPGYTKFDGSHKVLAAIQIIDATGAAHPYDQDGIHGHKSSYTDTLNKSEADFNWELGKLDYQRAEGKEQAERGDWFANRVD